MRVVSIQVGLPRMMGRPDADNAMDRPWTSGFFKEPVAGPVVVGRENLAGDGQADLAVHGGPDKAILAYAAAHYPLWRSELAFDGSPALLMSPGGFGENLTIDGLDETTVCVGDRFRIGAALEVEVSQPRQPCWKLARRWRMRDLPGRVVETGRSGWYFRVVELGTIEAPAEMTRTANPFPTLTIAALNEMLYGRRPASPAAVACPALNAGWRAHLNAIARRADNGAGRADG